MSEKQPLSYRYHRAAVLCAVIVMVVLYALSRAPFLPLGYGLDDDAWFVARAADTMANGGGYVASRLPGYPTVVLLFGLLFGLFGTSIVLGNLVAAIAGLAAAWGVWLILDGEVNLPLRVLASAAVGFHPAMWQASVTTLDPVFGAAFLILAALAVSRRRPLLGGLLLGLAVGCRITNALAAAPLALFANRKFEGWREAARVVVAGGVVGGALFLLPLMTYGLGFMKYEPVIRRDFITGGYKIYSQLVGLPLVLGLVLTFVTVLAFEERRQRLPEMAKEPLVLFGFTATVVLATPYVMLPTDPQYLLPWIPFTVLILAGLVRHKVVKTFWAGALLVAAVIPSFVSFGTLDLENWRSRQVLEPVWISRGQMVENYVDRTTQIERADSAAKYPFPKDSAVIVGRPFMATQLALGAPERMLNDYLYQVPEHDVLLFRLIPPWLFDRVENRTVFYAEYEHLPYLTRRIFGYELADVDAQPLQIWLPTTRDDKESRPQ